MSENMNRLICEALNAVRNRQHVQHFLRCFARGMFFAALTFPFLLTLHLWFLLPSAAGVVVLLILLFFCAESFAGLFFRKDSLQAAKLIDKHYGLKDRILTAAALLRKNELTAAGLTVMEQLQIADAAEHLAGFNPKKTAAEVLPLQRPKILYAALFLLAVDVAGYCYLTGNVNETVQKNLPAENPLLRDAVAAETKKLAEENPEEKPLAELSERIQTLTEKLEKTAGTPKEILQTFSEMDEAVQSAAESLQLETMNETMQEIAEALEIAEKTLPVSRALQKHDFAKAAAELKKLDSKTAESLTKPERKAMAEKMESVAKNAAERQQETLQKAAEKMSKALKEGNSEKAATAAKDLSAETEKHAVRQGIGKNLESRRTMLAMMKADNVPGNVNGGKQTGKTKEGSSHWGSGAAGNPAAGQQTSLSGRRRQEKLTGKLTGDGDSEKETSDSDKITAAESVRQYREQFQRYQKTAEAVLDSEPVPPGQRQTVRRYFESIRPAEVQSEDRHGESGH